MTNTNIDEINNKSEIKISDAVISIVRCIDEITTSLDDKGKNEEVCDNIIKSHLMTIDGINIDDKLVDVKKPYFKIVGYVAKQDQ